MRSMSEQGELEKLGKGAAFAPGRVGYAVGDIHGRLDLLRLLLENLEEASGAAESPPIVVFLGDYIDRGPASAQVLQVLISGAPEGCEVRYLMGNHEQSFLAFLDDPIGNRNWLSHGGMETIDSYGVAPPLWSAPNSDLIAAAEQLHVHVPEDHIVFLRSLERYVELGEYLFVHAGIDPDKPVSEQNERDLFWIRSKFLSDPRRYSHFVVHGHTPQDEVHFDSRRLGLDTGAYVSGLLSAARFEGDDVSLLQITAP